MTDKELRKLSRADLLEMLIEQSKEVRQLKQQLEAAECALSDRRIKISTSGSIAEAALKLNDVFEAADKASRQYLENTGRTGCVPVSSKTDVELRAKEAAANYMAEAVKQCRMIEEKTRRICEDMIEKAKTDPAEYERSYGSSAGEETESHRPEENRGTTDNRTSGRIKARKAKEQILRYLEKYRGYISRGGGRSHSGRNIMDACDEDIWYIDGTDSSRRPDRRRSKRRKI